MPTDDGCDELLELARAFLAESQDNEHKLRQFLDLNGVDDKRFLINTEDVMKLTGWGRTHISRLCTSGLLPHIPGKPHKFVPDIVRATLEQMQQGGPYGRRKSRMKGKMKK